MTIFQKVKRYLIESYMMGHYPSIFRVVVNKNNILAYYGFLGDGNFGDELVFQSTKKLFNGFYLLPIKKRMPLSIHFLLKMRIIRFSGEILGGGTLIGNYYYFNKSSKNIFFHGTGVRNDFSSEWEKVLVKQIYGGLRSAESKSRLKIDNNLNVIGDAAFYFYNQNLNGNYRAKKNRVLINMGTHVHCGNLRKSREEIKKFIEFALDKEISVEFLPFHFIDESIGVELKKDFPEIILNNIPKTYEDCAFVFNRVDFAIGERLHFIAMSLLSGIPCVSINYDIKHMDLLNSLNCENVGFDPDLVSSIDLIKRFNERNEFQWNMISERLLYFRNAQLQEAISFVKKISK